MYEYFKKMYKEDSKKLFSLLEDNLKTNKKTFIVTANPETFSHGKDEEFNKLLLDDITTIIPDGIGLVKAAKMLDINVKERIPGIDISVKLLEFLNKYSKKLYIFGSKQEVIDQMKAIIQTKYPNIDLVGMTNGYVKDKDLVMKQIKKLNPDVVMVALGVPAQEKLIYKHIMEFDKGIFIGVGGSFDVMAGNVKRAPKFFQEHGLEWFYRLCKQPQRIIRMIDLPLFILLVMWKRTKSFME